MIVTLSFNQHEMRQIVQEFLTKRGAAVPVVTNVTGERGNQRSDDVTRFTVTADLNIVDYPIVETPPMLTPPRSARAIDVQET